MIAIAYRKIPDINNGIVWMSIIIFLKLLLTLFFITFFTPEQSSFPGFWGNFANDTFGYIDPSEEFLKSFDFKYFFSYRMFGYTLPYIIIRLFFNQSTTLNILILIQTIFSAFSLYCLGLLTFQIFKNKVLFLVTLIVYFSIPIISFYDIFLLTESFTTSSLIISLYFLFKGESKINYLFSGLFITWSIFLRPVCFPIVLLFLFYIYIRHTKKSLYRFIKLGFLFLLPLIVFESVWIIGNLKYNNILTFTSPSTFAPIYADPAKHTMSLIAFSKAIGEKWEDSWFYSDNEQYPFDSSIETSKFNRTSLEELKKDIKTAQVNHVLFNDNTPQGKIAELNKSINSRLDLYTKSIKEEKPLNYYLLSSLKSLQRVFTSSSTFRMFGNYTTTSSKLVPFRIILDIIVWVMKVLFIFSLPLILLREWKNFELVFITGIILYFYLIHTIVFKANDFRYIIPVLPLMIVAIQSFLVNLLTFFKRSNENSLHN
jgi:hypothetical protein